MRDVIHSRVIGYVQLQIGDKTFSLPVQALQFDGDREGAQAGGFFAEEGTFGIVVDSAASPAMVKAQIAEAAVEAARHISRTLLN